MSITATAKAAVRPVLFRALGEDRARELSRRAHDAVTSLQYAMSVDGKISAQNLEGFRDRYAGKRCFVIGNGPSLRDMDLSPLRDEYTFGLNRIYLMFEKIGFPTTFLVSVNRYVSEQSGDEIALQPCEKFLSWRAGRSAPAGAHLTYLRTIDTPGFSEDPVRKGLWEGATVTYVALQLAHYMGFSEVILIGVDHSFATKGEPHKLVTSEAGDPNHFDPSYFGKGYRWQLPDLETSEIAYELARRTFEAGGRRILDATVGGKLQVFPKVAYDDIFGLRKAS
jgi:hypothetical protein